jgi:LuxR family maltose regulon positive regulatory protein
MAISHEADHALEILPVPPTPFRSPIARPRRASVSRASLVDRLETGTRRKLTVLMAPAGWGKTSLLAEWMATTSQPIVWLPLEARDNELARALRLLATAINQATPGLADDLLAALRTPYPPAVDDLVAILIGAISHSNASFVLVIDDVQHLTDPELQHGLQALVTGVPDSVRFVLSGRADPPLNLSRWRVLGEVTDIRIDDLRFDSSETARFFAQLPDLEVGEGGLETILTRTEGWAAGLQMAGLALRGRRIDDRAIAEFRGTQREVAGFLCEEVFSCQADEMRRFLMQISVFDKVSGAFCDAVLDRSDSQQMLEQATEANLFVNPIDAARQRFRMHPLFRDYLVSELERENPRAVRDLHRRAAAWLIENDLVMEAIDHLIVAGETEQSIDLIDRLSTNMVLTSNTPPHSCDGWKCSRAKPSSANNACSGFTSRPSPSPAGWPKPKPWSPT